LFLLAVEAVDYLAEPLDKMVVQAVAVRVRQLLVVQVLWAKAITAAQGFLVAVMAVAAVAQAVQAGLLVEALILLLVALEFHHLYLAHKSNMLVVVVAVFHQIT
jgi:hypothetical protein